MVNSWKFNTNGMLLDIEVDKKHYLCSFGVLTISTLIEKLQLDSIEDLFALIIEEENRYINGVLFRSILNFNPESGVFATIFLNYTENGDQVEEQIILKVVVLEGV